MEETFQVIDEEANELRLQLLNPKTIIQKQRI
jgi:hypothetical protein